MNREDSRAVNHALAEALVLILRRIFVGGLSGRECAELRELKTDILFAALGGSYSARCSICRRLFRGPLPEVVKSRMAVHVVRKHGVEVTQNGLSM